MAINNLKTALLLFKRWASSLYFRLKLDKSEALDSNAEKVFYIHNKPI